MIRMSVSGPCQPFRVGHPVFLLPDIVRQGIELSLADFAADNVAFLRERAEQKIRHAQDVSAIRETKFLLDDAKQTVGKVMGGAFSVQFAGSLSSVPRAVSRFSPNAVAMTTCLLEPWAMRSASMAARFVRISPIRITLGEEKRWAHSI